MKKIFSALLAIIMLMSLFCGCGSKAQSESPDIQSAPEPEPEVTIRIAGRWTDCRAIEWAAANFKEEYPNCTVIYEYLQGDFVDVLKERALSEGDDRVDMFFTTTNIQQGNDFESVSLDLMSAEGLDLSNTFPSLIDNYMYIESDGSPATKLYSIPLGAQMRGLFANVSLLNEAGIYEIPQNQEALLAACEKLQQAGYTPFHGEPSVFAHQLLYPWICNEVANADDYEKAYALVNSRDIEATELFREVYEFMYTLVENNYYDYYYTQKVLKSCVDSSNEGYARALLNIVEEKDASGEGTGKYYKGEGCGIVPFLPSALSLKTTIDKMKEDYHSDIDYAFMPAPVGENGGYVYLSPADAIAVNKDTEKLEWVVKFLNFLFTPENNEVFAELYSVIPNTKEAFSYVSTLYSVPENHISELGQATFDWSFYRTITRDSGDDSDMRALPAISRANHPDRLDPETGKMYPFEYFWERFQREFTGVDEK